MSAFPRPGRGISSTDNMTNRGPRCSRCGEFAVVCGFDANGKLICPSCMSPRERGIVVPAPQKGNVGDG